MVGSGGGLVGSGGGSVGSGGGSVGSGGGWVGSGSGSPGLDVLTGLGPPSGYGVKNSGGSVTMGVFVEVGVGAVSYTHLTLPTTPYV